SNPPSQTLNNLPPIAAGTSLNFVMLFNATQQGPRGGTLTLTDDATGSPHSFPISGTGFTGAMVQAHNNQVNLTTNDLGNPATAIDNIQSVGNQAATVTGVSISGTGFSQLNDCGASMAQGASCNININFNPSVAGPQTGTLTVSNTGVTNPLTI